MGCGSNLPKPPLNPLLAKEGTWGGKIIKMTNIKTDFAMLLIFKDLKSCLRALILSFWLVQNLSLLAEGFPTSGNDTAH
jgi:hypothetical protein